jgi:hypothetical protein
VAGAAIGSAVAHHDVAAGAVIGGAIGAVVGGVATSATC